MKPTKATNVVDLRQIIFQLLWACQFISSTGSTLVLLKRREKSNGHVAPDQPDMKEEPASARGWSMIS
ncbi:MAG TPA: hypothetical protein VFQ23_20585 [Anaerolineales bacterium]|nr:hypothetical protein [Anaerolineales bacterium]